MEGGVGSERTENRILQKQPFLFQLKQKRFKYSHASLNSGVRSEKCVMRRFRCVNIVACTYTNLDAVTYRTPRLLSCTDCDCTELVGNYNALCLSITVAQMSLGSRNFQLH